MIPAWTIREMERRQRREHERPCLRIEDRLPPDEPTRTPPPPAPREPIVIDVWGPDSEA